MNSLPLTRILMKDGVWLVPPEERPKGWESYGIAEPIAVHAEAPEPTQEQVAAVIANAADQMTESATDPDHNTPAETKLAGKEYQREYQRRLRADLAVFAEIAKTVEESALEYGCDRQLIKYGRLLVAGMFTNNNSRLCHMAGLKTSEMFDARLRLLRAGIWVTNPRRANTFCIHMGEGTKLRDLGFWMNAMIAAGQIGGHKEEDGRMLYNATERK